MEVLEVVARGYSNAEISGLLELSLHDVKECVTRGLADLFGLRIAMVTTPSHPAAGTSGADWVLSGQKMFITSAGFADVYVVFARTGGPGADLGPRYCVDRVPGMDGAHPQG